MCGFVGGVFKRTVATDDVAAFRRAVRTLQHRGPDAEAVTVIPGANAIFGFRRLAIIDLEGGAQPMKTETGQHIVFNGEVYNYQSLRPAVMVRGAKLRTVSDTEVMLNLLHLDGIEGLSAVKGMFGLAFLDENTEQLLLVRDRLGIKQVYHIETSEGLFFASEPKALLRLPGVWPALNRGQLASYFMLRSVPAPNTLYAGIERLGAGCALAVDLRTFRREGIRYWSPPAAGDRSVGAAERPSAHRPGIGDLEDALLEAVNRRLVADVPVGAFLSGGLDSSLVVAAMHKIGRRGMHTFTATFPGSPDDEASYARAVSQKFETRHHEFRTTPEGILTALDRWIGLNDDLVADASSMPLLLTSDIARSAGCIVLLSGEGADELFGGYGSYHKYRVLNRLGHAVPGQSVRAWMLRGAAALRLIGKQDVPRATEYFVRRGAFMGTAALAGAGGLHQLLSDDAFGATEIAGASGAALDDLCKFDLCGRIPDDLLVRTDRATMGASIEARVPFLDHDLVALALSMPSHLRAVTGLSKVALRRIAWKWGVPRQTIVHRKIGFQLPLGDWFRGPMRPLWSIVLEQRVVPEINYEEVDRLYTGHVRHQGEFEEMLWRVFALEAWYRRYVLQDAGAFVPPPSARASNPSATLVTV